MAVHIDCGHLSLTSNTPGLDYSRNTKGCLSLFNYFIDMKPEYMSLFLVEKTSFCREKTIFFWQKMDSLTRVSCLWNNQIRILVLNSDSKGLPNLFSWELKISKLLVVEEVGGANFHGLVFLWAREDEIFLDFKLGNHKNDWMQEF